MSKDPKDSPVFHLDYSVVEERIVAHCLHGDPAYSVDPAWNHLLKKFGYLIGAGPPESSEPNKSLKRLMNSDEPWDISQRNRLPDMPSPALSTPLSARRGVSVGVPPERFVQFAYRFITEYATFVDLGVSTGDLVYFQDDISGERFSLYVGSVITVKVGELSPEQLRSLRFESNQEALIVLSVDPEYVTLDLALPTMDTMVTIVSLVEEDADDGGGQDKHVETESAPEEVMLDI